MREIEFDIDPESWEEILREKNDDWTFELSSNGRIIRGKLLDMYEKPTVICSVEEEFTIQ